MKKENYQDFQLNSKRAQSGNLSLEYGLDQLDFPIYKIQNFIFPEYFTIFLWLFW